MEGQASLFSVVGGPFSKYSFKVCVLPLGVFR